MRRERAGPAAAIAAVGLLTLIGIEVAHALSRAVSPLMATLFARKSVHMSVNAARMNACATSSPKCFQLG